jgi:hypothetical protein
VSSGQQCSSWSKKKSVLEHGFSRAESAENKTGSTRYTRFFPASFPENSRESKKLEYIAGNLMFEPGEKTQKLHKIFEKMPSTA